MKIYTLIIIVLTCFQLTAKNNQQLVLSDVEKLSVEERRKLFGEIYTNRLANPNDLWLFLIRGLKDDDARVRFHTAATTYMIMTGMQALKIKGDKIPIDTSDIPKLQEALIQSLDDSDIEVRGASLSALPYTDAPNTKIENALLNRLPKEEKGEMRGEILKVLASTGYESENFKNVLLKTLEDKDPDALRMAANSIMTIKPANGLPKLIQLLKVDTNTPVKYIFSLYDVVDAIATYGAEAQPYLPQLEKFLVDRKKEGGGLPDRIEKAIETIRNPQTYKPAPHTRTVSLLEPSTNSTVTNRVKRKP